jgi:hypothetical protein
MEIDVLTGERWVPATRERADFVARTERGEVLALMDADEGKTWRKAVRVVEGDRVSIAVPGVGARESFTVKAVDYDAGVLVAETVGDDFVVTVKVSMAEVKWAKEA